MNDSALASASMCSVLRPLTYLMILIATSSFESRCCPVNTCPKLLLPTFWRQSQRPAVMGLINGVGLMVSMCSVGDRPWLCSIPASSVFRRLMLYDRSIVGDDPSQRAQAETGFVLNGHCVGWRSMHDKWSTDHILQACIASMVSYMYNPPPPPPHPTRTYLLSPSTSSVSLFPVVLAASALFCAFNFSSNFSNSFIAISSSASITCCTPFTSSI